MALTNLQYDNIKREYDADRMEADRLAKSRFETVCSRIEGFRDLNDSIATLTFECTERALKGDKSALSELSARISDLKDKKIRLLTDAGFPSDYLEPVYKCRECRDTGYIGGVKCRCFKLKETAILYDQSGIRADLNEVSFDRLSEKYYSGEDLAHFKESRSKSVNFVNKFGSDYQNLLFYGTVGTGKSLLSSCIAGALLKAGHSVLYFSSSALMDELARNTFDKGSAANDRTLSGLSGIEPIYECELLIIDDLGTEMTNNFTIASLFTLLNERALRRRPVIISTNLSLEGLQERYTDRIFSRLTGGYTFCRLSGPDIRIMQKLTQNS